MSLLGNILDKHIIYLRCISDCCDFIDQRNIFLSVQFRIRLGMRHHVDEVLHEMATQGGDPPRAHKQRSFTILPLDPSSRFGVRDPFRRQ